jgi:hypothetical protein
MSRQELYLFIHIAAAVLWVGGGTLLGIMGYRAVAANDREKTRVVVEEASQLATKLFIPAALVVVAMGLLLVLDGPWDFDLWVVLGLIGFASTFALGAGVLGPMTERITAQIEAEGYTDAADRESRKLLTLARIDSVVLFLVVADMALKPTGDDVGLLLVMAAVLVGGLAWAVSRYKAIDAEGATTPSGIATA